VSSTFLFDLDGTLLDVELLPYIAQKLGIEGAIEKLTRATVCGALPFHIGFSQRVNILKHFPVSEIRSIVSEAPINPQILTFIREHRSQCVVVTGNCDVWIEGIQSALGVPVECTRTACHGDRLVELTMIMDKGVIGSTYGSNVVAVGDGYNDIPMFLCARIGIAYGGVHPPARGLLSVATHAVYRPDILCRFLEQLS
jgi:HAD superfamily phosphoserine phosphatase-like hydrolase